VPAPVTRMDVNLNLSSYAYPDGFTLKWNNTASRVKNVINNKTKGKGNYNEPLDKIPRWLDFTRKDPMLKLGSYTFPDGFTLQWNNKTPRVKNVINNKTFKGKGNYNEPLDKIPQWFDFVDDCGGLGYIKVEENATTEEDILNA
jgi:hypothetical protein